MSTMAPRRLGISVLFLFLSVVCGGVLRMQNTDWMGNPPTEIMEGDVECFSEYMELWIHRLRAEGLRLWLSAMLRIEVTFGSLDNLNYQLSACGFGLHKDPDRNFIFRVMYTGCFVQKEHGHYVITLNLIKRISRFGGRTHNYVMKCPVVPAPPNTEHIQCDPDFIQVTREIPVDSWNNELGWSLALRGSLVVALEDASLIQVTVQVQKPFITVQGRRNTVLSPVQVLQTEGQFLPLKLVSGQYAYSMEATCPNVVQHSSEDTVLHIYKRRMGLTKRGGYDSGALSVSSVAINQTDTFTWSETTSFVKLVIPTALIQKTKECADKESDKVLQSFFRVDVLLTFKEMNYRMLWTMENTSPCSNDHISSATTRPSVTTKSPVTSTALNPTVLNSVTQEPPISSRLKPQTSSLTTGAGLSPASAAFQPITVSEVAPGSPWGSVSLHDAFRTTSPKPHTSTDSPGDLVSDPVPSVAMGSDTTRVSLSNPEPLTDLTLTVLTSTEPETGSNINNANTSTSPSTDQTIWTPVTLQSPILNTVSDITLNTPPKILPPPQPLQRVARPSSPSPQPDATVPSAVLNKTAITHTTNAAREH